MSESKAGVPVYTKTIPAPNEMLPVTETRFQFNRPHPTCVGTTCFVSVLLKGFRTKEEVPPNCIFFRLFQESICFFHKQW